MSGKSSGGQPVTEYKYTFDQTKEWAKREDEPLDDGITLLYVFGALAFLFIFAALLIFFVSGPSEPISTVHISESGSETDVTTSEIHSEFDLLEDTQKKKNNVTEAKS